MPEICIIFEVHQPFRLDRDFCTMLDASREVMVRKRLLNLIRDRIREVSRKSIGHQIISGRWLECQFQALETQWTISV